MAHIYVDVSELPAWLNDLSCWAGSADQIFVTRGGRPVFRLVPADGAAAPPSAPPTTAPPRPLGTHPGVTTLPPDFNKPFEFDAAAGTDGGR